ncbi:MAG: hypothetical protein FWH45_01790 [Methanomassiliicoccaceae archaeon]|nr:hypothetical protein [Methanomassiliicoccaceae archaeon]
MEGKDIITVFFETKLPEEKRPALEKETAKRLKETIGVMVIPKAVNIGDLPRSEKKTNRIFDNRY